MKYNKLCDYSILGGALIALCAYAYTLIENKYVGAGLFAFGLVSIVFFGYKLYTGFIGTVKTGQDLRTAAIILGANLFGAVLVGILAALAGCNNTVWAAKMQAGLLPFAIRSFFCGIVIHLGVKGGKQGKYILTIMAVMMFVLCGFEHCIANVFYIITANTLDVPRTLAFYGINVLGNSVGALAAEYLGRE